MDLKHLRFFCLVAELEHITKAAEILMVSQPYLTLIINNIEKELGVELFDHVGRKIKLNKHGLVFYARSKKLLQDFEDAQIEVQELAQQEERKLSIMTNVSIYMPGLLGAFQSSYPGTTIYQYSVRRKDIITALGAGEVDYAICTPPIEEDEETAIKTQVVFKDWGSLICSPGHPFLEKGIISIRDLEKESLISSLVGFGTRDHVDRVFASVGIRPNIVVESSDTSAVPRYVKAGLGIAIVPKSFFLADPVWEQNCVEVSDMEIIGYTGLSWNKNRFEKKIATVFRDFATEYFKNIYKELD